MLRSSGSLLACIVIVTFNICFVIGDPDANRNVSQLIKARGYPEEDHQTTTSDGFVLSIQRITGSRNSQGTPNVKKPVVLLQHGVLDNSFTWVSQEITNESLGFILADQGYDVWLSNVRGNTYSNSNIYYKPSQTQFWAWSFDEMAQIDLPTIINYVLKTTGAAKLSYIGHSQGTMIGFLGFENAEVASKVNIFIALAPVAYVYHTTSVLLRVLADLKAEYILQILGVKDFAPDTTILKILLPTTCGFTPDACDNLLGLVMGWNTTDVNNTRLPVLVAHEPSGTSMQNMLHWSQLETKNVIQAYDYGSASANMQHYNSSAPPLYDPSRITIPTALFYGGQDALADPADVAQLIPLLKNLVHLNYQPSYAHIDFVWGVDAAIRIYSDVLRLLSTYSTN